MNENSPIWASAMATESATRNGYRKANTMANAASGLPTRTTASVAATSPGACTREAGVRSMPTDTKNKTANASRMGRASDAARRLNSDCPTTIPARNAPSAIDTPNTVAVALAQIGEFSFILASLGRQLGILPNAARDALVAAAIISITLNPLLYRLVAPAEAWVVRRPRLGTWLKASARREVPAGPKRAADRTPPPYRAVVVGYGPIGRTVTRLLRENGIEPTVIELNLDTARRLQQEGVSAVYGDATHRDTLTDARVDRAGSLILTSSGMHGSEEVIRMARELNPDIRVLARSAYLRELDALRRAGAETAIAGEGEVALALTEALLRRLGATPEQIDRERERVRGELFGHVNRDDPAAPAVSGPRPPDPSHREQRTTGE